MRSRLRIYGVVLLAAAFIVSCSKTPEGVLSEKKMKDVMVDMQLAESMIINSKKYGGDAEKEALYQSVFRKHNIQKADYDSSLVWYGHHLEVYMQVYDLVLAEINERQKALGDVQMAAAPVSKRDSVDIWPRRTYLTLTPDALFNGVTVDIKPEKNYPSGSTFVLGVRVWGLNKNMKEYPAIKLSANQGDTTIVVNNKILSDGYHETVLQTVPTKQVKSIFGAIRLENEGGVAPYFKIYVDSLNLMRYNYGHYEVKADPKKISPKDKPL